MELRNDTPFPARLLRFQPNEDAPVEGTLVVKATFEHAADGRWIPVDEQLPILDDPLLTPFGLFHGEGFVSKEGVDVCVMGTVRPARVVRATELSLRVGAHTSTLMVYGDRRWVRTRGELAASSPETFTELPLAYARAYGGATEHDYEQVVWPDNPIGRGYYLSAAGAEGGPLPNIESAAERPVRAWSDQPTTAGWAPYPCFWGIRAREGFVSPEVVKPGNFGYPTPRLNNNAHPELVLPALPEGAEIRIRGLRASELAYTLPRLSVRLTVTSGSAVVAEPLTVVDGVYLWADLGHITLTGRARFGYLYTRGEIRGAQLSLGD